MLTFKENEHPENDLGFLCRGPRDAWGLACWRLSDRLPVPEEMVMWNLARSCKGLQAHEREFGFCFMVQLKGFKKRAM